MSTPIDPGSEANTSRNADSGRIGKAVEHLVAASCIITSGARLNVSTSLVDDEGVDLVFFRRGGTATVAVQVKCRMTDAAPLTKGTYQASVRNETFRARDDLHMLFVAVNPLDASLPICWWIPSAEFAQIARIRGAKKRWTFVASMSHSGKDQWSPYRLQWKELPERILADLAARES